jgi:hypothetical protein
MHDVLLLQPTLQGRGCLCGFCLEGIPVHGSFDLCCLSRTRPRQLQASCFVHTVRVS